MRSARSALGLRGRNVVGLALAASGVLLMAACGGGTSSGSVPIGTVSTTPAPTTTAPPATVGPATTAPPTTASGPTTPRTTSPAGEELSGFQTDPFRREHSLAVPPIPRLVGIRGAAHAGYDRVVFDFEGPLPGAVSVRYVDRVIADGSGNPVAVAGQAFLQVRFEEAQAHTDAGASTVVQRSQPGLPMINEVVMAGDYEGYVTVALGLKAGAPFRVLELTNPTRVVVDVRT